MTENRLANLDQYLDRMTRSTGETSKSQLVGFAQGPVIIDFGCGSGVLTHMLAEKYPDATVYGIESCPKIAAVAAAGAKENEIICDSWPKGVVANTIIFSSVLHEVYSYPTEEDNVPFSLLRVIVTLYKAYTMLAKDGILLIRDGAYCTDKDYAVIQFKEPDGFYWFNCFMDEFEAPLPNKEVLDANSDYAIAPKCLIKEFLYTYTWGPDSWPREIQECMGVLPLDKYKEMLEILGFKVLSTAEFTELGYNYHINKLVWYHDLDGEPLELPHSTIFIVAKK